MPKYILAIKRGKRDVVPPDWLERVTSLKGVTLESSASTERAQIEVRADVLPQVQQAIGEFCHIEPVILHHRSGN